MGTTLTSMKQSNTNFVEDTCAITKDLDATVKDLQTDIELIPNDLTHEKLATDVLQTQIDKNMSDIEVSTEHGNASVDKVDDKVVSSMDDDRDQVENR